MKQLLIKAAAPLVPALALLAAGCAPDAGEADAETPVEDVAQAEEEPAKLTHEGRYRAFLQGPDRTDGAGNPLTEAWQIIREDRVNFHERGVRQDIDEDDPLFADADNRDRIEEMVAAGNLTPGSAGRIVDGDVMADIDVFTRNGEPARIDVSVF